MVRQPSRSRVARRQRRTAVVALLLALIAMLPTQVSAGQFDTCSNVRAIPGNSHAVTDTQCAPCSNGVQTVYPCPNEGLCYCGTGTIPPQYLTAFSHCTEVLAVTGNNQGADDVDCAPCKNGEKTTWPCNKPMELCKCADGKGYVTAGGTTSAPAGVPSPATIPTPAPPVPTGAAASIGAVQRWLGRGGTGGTSGGAGVGASILPWGCAWGPDASMYFTNGNAIAGTLQVSQSVSALAGDPSQIGDADGSVGAARFGEPSGIVYNPRDDSLVICDLKSHSVRHLTLSATPNVVSYPVGQPHTDPGYAEGNATTARFARPYAIARDQNGDWLAVVEDTGKRVRKINLDPVSGRPAMTALLAGDGSSAIPLARFNDGAATTEATFGELHGVTITPDGAAWVCDKFYDRLRSVSGGEVNSPSGAVAFGGCGAVTHSPDGSSLFVTAPAANKIFRYDVGSNLARVVFNQLGRTTWSDNAASSLDASGRQPVHFCWDPSDDQPRLHIVGAFAVAQVTFDPAIDDGTQRLTYSAPGSYQVPLRRTHYEIAVSGGAQVTLECISVNASHVQRFVVTQVTGEGSTLTVRKCYFHRRVTIDKIHGGGVVTFSDNVFDKWLRSADYDGFVVADMASSAVVLMDNTFVGSRTGVLIGSTTAVTLSDNHGITVARNRFNAAVADVFVMGNVRTAVINVSGNVWTRPDAVAIASYKSRIFVTNTDNAGMVDVSHNDFASARAESDPAILVDKVEGAQMIRIAHNKAIGTNADPIAYPIRVRTIRDVRGTFGVVGGRLESKASSCVSIEDIGDVTDMAVADIDCTGNPMSFLRVNSVVRVLALRVLRLHGDACLEPYGSSRDCVRFDNLEYIGSLFMSGLDVRVTGSGVFHTGIRMVTVSHSVVAIENSTIIVTGGSKCSAFKIDGTNPNNTVSIQRSTLRALADGQGGHTVFVNNPTTMDSLRLYMNRISGEARCGSFHGSVSTAFLFMDRYETSESLLGDSAVVVTNSVITVRKIVSSTFQLPSVSGPDVVYYFANNSVTHVSEGASQTPTFRRGTSGADVNYKCNFLDGVEQVPVMLRVSTDKVVTCDPSTCDYARLCNPVTTSSVTMHGGMCACVCSAASATPGVLTTDAIPLQCWPRPPLGFSWKAAVTPTKVPTITPAPTVSPTASATFTATMTMSSSASAGTRSTTATVSASGATRTPSDTGATGSASATSTVSMQPTMSRTVSESARTTTASHPTASETRSAATASARTPTLTVTTRRTRTGIVSASTSLDESASTSRPPTGTHRRTPSVTTTRSHASPSGTVSASPSPPTSVSLSVADSFSASVSRTPRPSPSESLLDSATPSPPITRTHQPTATRPPTVSWSLSRTRRVTPSASLEPSASESLSDTHPTISKHTLSASRSGTRFVELPSVVAPGPKDSPANAASHAPAPTVAVGGTTSAALAFRMTVSAVFETASTTASAAAGSGDVTDSAASSSTTPLFTTRRAELTLTTPAQGPVNHWRTAQDAAAMAAAVSSSSSRRTLLATAAATVPACAPECTVTRVLPSSLPLRAAVAGCSADVLYVDLTASGSAPRRGATLDGALGVSRACLLVEPSSGAPDMLVGFRVEDDRPEPPKLSESVKEAEAATTTAATAAAAAGGSPVTAAQVSRVGAIAALAACEGTLPEELGNTEAPFQFVVSPVVWLRSASGASGGANGSSADGGEDADRAAAVALSINSVVSNVAFMACFVGVHFLLGLVVFAVKQQTLLAGESTTIFDALGAVRFPGLAIVPLLMTVQQVAVGVVAAFLHGPTSGLEGASPFAVGVAGTGFVILVSVFVAWFVGPGRRARYFVSGRERMYDEALLLAGRGTPAEASAEAQLAAPYVSAVKLDSHVSNSRRSRRSTADPARHSSAPTSPANVTRAGGGRHEEPLLVAGASDAPATADDEWAAYQRDGEEHRSGCVRVVVDFLMGTGKWVSDPELQRRGVPFARLVGLLMVDYRSTAPWFMVAEIVTSVVIGGLAGIAPSTVAGCRVVAVLTTCVFTLYLAALLALWPFAVPFTAAVAVPVAVLQAVGTGAMTGYLYHPERPWLAEMGLWLPMAGLYVMLAKQAVDLAMVVIEVGMRLSRGRGAKARPMNDEEDDAESGDSSNDESPRAAREATKRTTRLLADDVPHQQHRRALPPLSPSMRLSPSPSPSPPQPQLPPPVPVQQQHAGRVPLHHYASRREHLQAQRRQHQPPDFGGGGGGVVAYRYPHGEQDREGWAAEAAHDGGGDVDFDTLFDRHFLAHHQQQQQQQQQQQPPPQRRGGGGDYTSPRADPADASRVVHTADLQTRSRRGGGGGRSYDGHTVPSVPEESLPRPRHDDVFLPPVEYPPGYQRPQPIRHHQRQTDAPTTSPRWWSEL